MKKVLIWIIAFLPLIATAVLYPSLPETVPTHWNIQGEIDGWGSRSTLFITAVLSPILCLGMQFLPKIDPKRENYKKFTKGYFTLQVCLVLFFALMQGIILYASAYNSSLNTTRITLCGMGLLFCVIGNFMPKFRHNYFCGFRTPWTLASETVWDKTHRFGGALWFWAGLITFVGSLFLPIEVSYSVFFVVIMSSSLATLGYSWWIWKKEQTK